MSMPDYISPIVGYRVWTWGTMGLKSLSGTSWHPCQVVAARCRASIVGGRGKAKDYDHEAPHVDCTCGIYAAKTLDHFRSAEYERYGIYGEVYLWGTVVEHELGYRAQFAYPKNFVLHPDTLPFSPSAMQARLNGLVAFGIPIFVADVDRNIPLWTKDSGLNPKGLDYLIEMGKEYYVRRQRDKILTKGDRVTVLSRGTTVVEHVNSEWIQAVVLNKCTLRIARKCIRWDVQYRRWETIPSACVEPNGKATGK
jgi:hypothetical protein